MILKKKILIVSWKSIDQGVINKNYINDLRKKYKIYLLDISFILGLDLSFLVKKKINSKKNLEIIKIFKFKDFKNKIDKIRPDIIIPYILEDHSLKTKKIFNFLKKIKVPLVKIHNTDFIDIFKYYKSKIKQLLFKRKIHYDYLIHTGSRNSYDFYKSKNNIYIHHQDYENFLKKNKKNNLKTKRYAVFLDENFVYHPDMIINKKKDWVSPKNYFKSMNNFFSFLTDKFNLDIKIASHPSNYNNYFGKYKTYFNFTAELVSNADLVLLHQSTSVSYPILFKKKILFLTSNEINKKTGNIKDKIFSLAKFFNNEPINIDENLSKKYIQKNIISDSINYKKFKDLFLKHPKSEDKNFIYIFKKYFN